MISMTTDTPTSILKMTCRGLDYGVHFNHLLLSNAGPLDVLGTVTQGRDYDDLVKHSAELIIQEGLTIRLLDLPTLIQLKEELNREKDRAILSILRHTLAETSQDKPK